MGPGEPRDWSAGRNLQANSDFSHPYGVGGGVSFLSPKSALIPAVSLHPLGLCFSPLRRTLDLVLSPSLSPFLPIVSQSLSLHLSQSNSISLTVPPSLPRGPSPSLRSLHLFRSPSLSPPRPPDPHLGLTRCLCLPPRARPRAWQAASARGGSRRRLAGACGRRGALP